MVTPRQVKILHWLIKDHVRTASPVGSGQLAQKKTVKCSSATIRNEMTSLEAMGFIEQPHTSAGRIPTDAGYRYYVDNIIKPEPISPEDLDTICKKMEDAKGNINLLLEEASRMLGVISKELGVVLTPWISWGIFDRMELIELNHNKALAVIHVKSRLVKTIILKLDSSLSPEDLRKTSALLNERLSGLTLEEIKNTIGERVRNIRDCDYDLLRLITESASELFDFSEPLDVHTSGTQNIVSQPEFSKSDIMNHIFALIDDRKRLIPLFHRKVQATEVCIGNENRDTFLKPFTVITSCYKRGRDIGSLGVIGLTRMNYSKVLPLVDTMAKTMSRYLS